MIPYNNTWTSVAAYLKQQKDMIVANGLCTADEIQMWDWEDHANEQDLPETHLLGPASLAIEEMSANIYSATFSVGLSTYNDVGLFNHRKMVDVLGKALGSGQRTVVYDVNTQQPYSWLKIQDGTTVAPLSKANNRAFQVIQVEALLDPLA